VLQQAIGDRVGVSIKTRLADIVKCPDELWETPHGRRLCQKHVDFVLYDRTTSAVIAAIELDDASHNEPHRQERDRFVNEVFKVVSVRLIRVRAASRYDREAIRRELFFRRTVSFGSSKKRTYCRRRMKPRQGPSAAVLPPYVPTAGK
jgi:hypothetical protein